LSPFRTLQTVQGDGTITQYNPLGILGLAVLGMAVIAGVIGLIAWASPVLEGLSNSAVKAADTTQKASQKLDRELAQVLVLIRGHIASSESYAKSLASAQTRLAGLTEAEQVRVIVSLLVAENERMRRDGSELNVKLEQSRKQIEDLRTSLSVAEEVVLKDPLTGVGNRRCFDVMMEKAIAGIAKDRTPLSLIIGDIDHFKRVNDAFGHQVGDEIIKMFSRVIETSVRDGDTVIRYGGEEFAVILPTTDQEAATAIAERIRRQFESKKLTIRETNQKVGLLTASFGVAQFRLGDDADTFFKRADAKLYDAKSAGRNRVASFGDID
jgi:diguanylate cyclase